MAHVVFTSHLRSHLDCPDADVAGETLGDVLRAVFATNPRLRGYLLDDQSRIRPHVAIFVDGRLHAARNDLTAPVSPTSEIYVMQALSGG